MCYILGFEAFAVDADPSQVEQKNMHVNHSPSMISQACSDLISIATSNDFSLHSGIIFVTLKLINFSVINCAS